jgi:hypothetical protein
MKSCQGRGLRYLPKPNPVIVKYPSKFLVGLTFMSDILVVRIRVWFIRRLVDARDPLIY